MFWNLYGSLQLDCGLSLPPRKTLYLYLDLPHLKILSVMYWEALLVKYT